MISLFSWFSSTGLRGDPATFDRWRWLKRHLMPGPLRTLDAGCGYGSFTIHASRIGNESIGLSIEEEQIQKARVRAGVLRIRNVRFIQNDLRDLDKFADQLGKFDQIICFETIEHILDDRKLLADLSALLKPGGRLLLTTPFRHYRPLWGDKLSPYEDGGHVRWGYTCEEMGELLNECGLEVVLEEYISGFVSQQLMNLMRILSKENTRIVWALIFPLRLFQILDSPLTRLIGYPYLSIGVVAVKQGGDGP